MSSRRPANAHASSSRQNGHRTAQGGDRRSCQRRTSTPPSSPEPDRPRQRQRRVQRQVNSGSDDGSEPERRHAPRNPSQAEEDDVDEESDDGMLQGPDLSEDEEDLFDKVVAEAEVDDDDDDGPEGEDLPLQWNVDNFQNVPMGRTLARDHLLPARIALEGGSTNIQQGLELLQDTAEAFETVNRNHKDIEKCQDCFLRLLGTDKEREIHLGVTNALMAEVATTKMENLPDIFKQRNVAEISELRKLTKRQKFQDDERFIGFRRAVWEINHEDEVLPPMTTWLPKQDGDPDTDEEEELTYGGARETFKCPMTMRIVEDCHKSTKCNHIYSGQSIMEYFNLPENRGKAVVCPVAACKVIINRSDVIRDPQTQKRADDFAAREKRREARQMDEDAIELDDDGGD